MADNLLESAMAELEMLLRQRAECDRRIEALQKAVKILEPIYRQTGTATASVELLLRSSDLGLTDRVRAILQASERPLSPTQVRERVQDSGLDLSEYSNPLATVHSVLRRLVEAQQVIAKAGIGGTKFYEWIGEKADEAGPFAKQIMEKMLLNKPGM
jgi:hypothetical protein